MEDFSCWWRPLDNLTDGEQVTYDLRYSHGYVGSTTSTQLTYFFWSTTQESMHSYDTSSNVCGFSLQDYKHYFLIVYPNSFLF